MMGRLAHFGPVLLLSALAVLQSCGGQMTAAGLAGTATAYASPEAGAVPGNDETELLVEGVAAAGGASTAMARDEAIDDALRKAVEQGVGTYIDSETQVSSFQLISDNIYSRARGYVSSYEILDEREQEGLYRVVIRAVVRTGAIEDDLTAIGILLAEQGRPRVMAVIRETEGSEEPDRIELTDEAPLFETMVLEHFRSTGFPVVDADELQEIIEEDQLRLVLAGDQESAVLLGLEAEAEIVISGIAVHSLGSRLMAGSERDIHEYSVSTRAINTRTGSIMAASALTVTLPFSRSAARERAADSTASYLQSAILDGWTGGWNTTTLIATNADFQKVQALREDILQGVRGVVDVVNRGLTGSRAELEIVSETSSSEVMDDIAGLGTGISVTGFFGNRMEIRFGE